MSSDTNSSRRPPGDEPEATAGEVGRRCGLCQAVIPAEFFAQGATVVCPSCALGIGQRLAGRGKLRRALIFGALAATILATLWYLSIVASSRPLAGVAVLAGIVIGLAVHWGSGRRGGLRYQIAAALLVYAAFVARSVPPVFGGIADAIKQQHAAATASPPTEHASGDSAPAAAGPSTGGPSSASATSDDHASSSQTSVLATFKAYFVFTAIAWGLVLASPFLPGQLGILPLLSLALGMATAAGLNRRVRLQGPFPGSGPS
jgi:hypothetical protein